MMAIPTLIRSNRSTIVVNEPIRRPLFSTNITSSWEGSSDIGTRVTVSTHGKYTHKVILRNYLLYCWQHIYSPLSKIATVVGASVTGNTIDDRAEALKRPWAHMVNKYLTRIHTRIKLFWEIIYFAVDIWDTHHCLK